MTQLVAPITDDLNKFKQARREARPSVCTSAAAGAAATKMWERREVWQNGCAAVGIQKTIWRNGPPKNEWIISFHIVGMSICVSFGQS